MYYFPSRWLLLGATKVSEVSDKYGTHGNTATKEVVKEARMMSAVLPKCFS